MKICVVGVGYVGLVTAGCLAEAGNNVVCVDVDSNKIAGLKSGAIPIYEPGLAEIAKHNVKLGRLCFTTDLKEGINNSLIIFLAVGTPQVNKNAQGRFAKRITDYFAGREDETVLAVWELSFKAKTDDVRESPAIYCISKLLDCGMKIRAYDPEAPSAAMAALDNKI